MKCGDAPHDPPRATPEFSLQCPNGSYQLWERRDLGRVREPVPPPLLSAPAQSRPPPFPSLDGAWMTASELPAGCRGGAGRAPRAALPAPRSAARPPAGLHRGPAAASSSRRRARGTAASPGENGRVIRRALRAALVAPVDTRNYLYFLIKILETLGVFFTELASRYQKVFLLPIYPCFSLGVGGFQRSHRVNRFLYT